MEPSADKLQLMGASSLTDAELVGLLLDDANGHDARKLAEDILDSFGGSLPELARAEIARLRMVGGVGLKRALRLSAALELGRRATAAEATEADFISSSEDVVRIFRPQLDALPHEECWALFLSSSNRILERRKVSQGGVQGTVVDHRLVIKRALELLATQMILVHNHPSGNASPSEQDKVLTSRIAQAAQLFDIRLLDHLIIARSGSYGFREHGLL